jgi:hypothetical protein
VVVHLRIGDLTLPTDQTFLPNVKATLVEVSHSSFELPIRHMLGQLTPALAWSCMLLPQGLIHDYPIHWYFIADSQQHVPDGKPPPAFEYLSTAFNGSRVTYLTDLDPFGGIHHMMHADMLVMTGSGFPYAAAVLGWRPMVIHGENKCPGKPFLYPDWVQVDQTGKLISPSVEEVKAGIIMRKQRSQAICGR